MLKAVDDIDRQYHKSSWKDVDKANRKNRKDLVCNREKGYVMHCKTSTLQYEKKRQPVIIIMNAFLVVINIKNFLICLRFGLSTNLHLQLKKNIRRLKNNYRMKKSLFETSARITQPLFDW